jgi:flagellar protein FlaI
VATKGLPFQRRNFNEGFQWGQTARSPAYSPELQAACTATPFLGEYVECLPVSDIGVPIYYPKLSRQLQKLEVRNLIYPIAGNLFVHIYPDETGARDYYVSIEPDLTVDIGDLIKEVELQLVDYAEEVGEVETKEERREVLLRVLDEICTTDPTDAARIYMTERELEAIKYYFVREKTGLGALQPLLQDPYIEDISCSGLGPIFVEHKIFRSLQSSIVFEDHDDLDEFVVWMGEAIKRPVTVRNPIIDAVLPDGSRINVVYGREIATRGSNFTIRKFSETPLSVLELIDFGSLNYPIAAYLSMMLEEGMNLFVAGATASGKTTLLNAINTFILPDAKIVSIEDTPEIQVPHKNWCREVTRAGAQGDAKGSEVGMFELLKAALRQRPDRIIIGEIRGEEGRIAFQAMQTGHGVMSTFHAASVEKLIQRLTGDPISVPKTYLDNLNIVVIQAAVRRPDGRMVRRVLSVNEIIGYDSSSGSFSYIEVFRWNPSNDTFEFPGNMNSFLLEERIAPRKGIPPNKRKSIYAELEKRARIFQRLHDERHIRSFDDFFKILAEAHRQGLI